MPTALPRYITKPCLGARLNHGHPLARRLVARWLMNEGGGGVIYDIAGQSHGSLTNGPSWLPDRYGVTLDFDGGNDYVDCGDNPSQNPSMDGWSMSVWAKATTWPSGVEMLAAKYTTDAANEYYIGVYEKKARAFLRSNGTPTKITNSSQVLTDGEWTHLAWTWSGVGADSILVYVNGVEDSSIEVNAVILGFGDSAEHLLIGARNGGGSAWFDGSIDNVSIYNRALTADEVLWFYVDPYADIQPLPIRIWANAPVVGVDFPELLPIMGVG